MTTWTRRAVHPLNSPINEHPARVVPAGSATSFDGVAGKNLFNQYQRNRFSTLYTLPVLHGTDSLRAPSYDPVEGLMV